MTPIVNVIVRIEACELIATIIEIIVRIGKGIDKIIGIFEGRL